MGQEQKDEFIALRKQYIENRFGRLNPMQKQAVFTGKGPLLILAGAGSGKTTVLVNRVANLVLFGDAFNSEIVYNDVTDEDVREIQELVVKAKEMPTQRMQGLLSVDAVRPYNILAITFTNKAAGELKARLKAMLGEMSDDINAATFHSSCVRILRQQAEHLGYPKAFTIYDSDDATRSMKEIFKQLSIDDKFLPVKAALSAIGRLKDKMISPKDALQDTADARAGLVAKVYAAYAKRLKSAGAMDFDDLIYNTVKLLQENEEVRKHYQNRFKYILVDEYQDTSIAQFKLVDLLGCEHKNVCVVGDDDQSIYRFRGATIENILSFEQLYQNTKVIRLEQNYRSTSNILNAANSVIENNTGRKGKTLWTDNGDGTKITHYEAENEHEEATHIGEIISENIKNGDTLRSHAILYRMNALSNPIETYFARAGIAYKIVGGQRFFDRKEVKDIISYLSIVANPRDDLRLKRIINEPSRKIGLTTIDTATEIASDEAVSLLDVVGTAIDRPRLARAANALQGFMDIYYNLMAAYNELSLADFVGEVVNITGYKTMLDTQGEEGKTRMENIGQLVSSVKTYEQQQGEDASLEGFLEDVALISDLDSYDEGADVIVLMTLHAAKGLEFDNVFVVGMEDGIFPSEMCRYNPEDLEEERRLCYVGITRAKKKLMLSSAASRMMFGQTKRNTQSRFLKEIDAQYIEFEQSGGAQYASRMRARYENQINAPQAPKAATSRSTINAGMANSGYQSVAQKTTVASAKVHKTGDRIKHMSYGEGTVIKTTPMAGDILIEIKFDKQPINKKVMANFAKLEDI